nr:PTS sugar transporter subunit IIB [[Clostridium] innocuum]
MVELLRIDDRLLHGQVAFSWVNRYAPDAILIANDEVMHNEIQKMAIKMAKPAGMKMAIKTLQDGIDLINNEHVKQMSCLLLSRPHKMLLL